MSTWARVALGLAGAAAIAIFVSLAITTDTATAFTSLFGLFVTVAIGYGVIYGFARLITRRRPGEDAAALRRRIYRVTALGCLITLAIGLILFGLCLAALNNTFG
jgi:hypothetical protein